MTKVILFFAIYLTCVPLYAQNSNIISGSGFYNPDVTCNGIGIKLFDEYKMIIQNNGYLQYSSKGNMFFPLLSWPLVNLLHDRTILVNYIDHLSTTQVQDYMGFTHTYDDHPGTDIFILNFREMDKGMKIRASAPGIVVLSVFNNPDRNITDPMVPANLLAIRHSDSTFAYYFHQRKNSNTVCVGDTIMKGTIIGFAGSSGPSTGPHVHLEIGQYVDSVIPWRYRDPWNGPYNNLPSLWQNQEPYVGNVPFRAYDMGIYTRLTVGGNIGYISGSLLTERVWEPVELGYTEPYIGLWLQFQGNQGGAYKVEIRKPNSELFAEKSVPVNTKYRIGWAYHYWGFNINPPVYGQWYARILVNNVETNRINFVVGPTTMYNPRFKPVAGRTFRRQSTYQKDTLRVEKWGSSLPITYSLIDNPDFISIQNDSIVNINPEWNLQYRTYSFQAVAYLGGISGGLRDTFWYQLIDTTKPMVSGIHNGGNGTEIPGKFKLKQNFPNPFNSTTNIRFDIPENTHVKINVYNVIGVLISTPVNENFEAGEYGFTFDASGLSSGIYFYRIEAGKFSQTRRMILLK